MTARAQTNDWLRGCGMCGHGKRWHVEPCPCRDVHVPLVPAGACGFHYLLPEVRCACTVFVGAPVEEESE